MDVAKHLAVNCSTQRERDDWIIANATHFQCIYKTSRRNLPSDNLQSLADARATAKFASELLFPFISRKGGIVPIKVVALLRDLRGNEYSALVEEIRVGQ